jgi:hypothetical protein
LKNSNNIKRWWRTKLVTKSKCYDLTMKENLCSKNLTHFLRNVEFNNKQVCPIPHNKTVLQNHHGMCKKHDYCKGLELEFWGEAVNTTMYIKIRCLTKALDSKAPQKTWSGRKPNVSHLIVFGCKVFAHVPDEKSTKLKSKSMPCVFLRYYESTKTYRVMCVETKIIVKNKDVMCRNHSFGLATKVRACKVMGQERKPGSHIPCSREYKRVWVNEPSHSQVNSHFGSWSPNGLLNLLEGNYKCQNPLDYRVSYNIINLLKHRCLKWACMNHLDIWNTNYGPKKG